MTLKKQLIFITLLFTYNFIIGQINLQDSSVQVISYWNIGDKYEYEVSLQTIKYEEQDTSLNETITYDVDVSVLDSTESSYTIRWFYKNFKSDSKNPMMQKISMLAEDIAVDIKLNDVGMIEGIKNWEEVRDYMKKATDSLVKDIPHFHGKEKIIAQINSIYASKASIESQAILDVQQFHFFHGGRYILHDTIRNVIKTANMYESDRPFDTEISICLEDINETNNYFKVRCTETIDSEQLTETTFNYLNKMAIELGQQPLKRESFLNLENYIETLSFIHNDGWVLTSKKWKETFTDGKTSLEIRTIQMK